MFKLSNETKVGVLAVVSVTVLIFGYNLLKGKNLFNKNKWIYAKYDNVGNLPVGAPVFYKGLQIGTTGKLQETDVYISKIIVPINLTRDVKLPKNSIALISSSFIGLSGAVIDIKPGDDLTHYITIGDTIRTDASSSLMNEVTKTLNPVLFEVTNAVHSLDSVLGIIANTFDPTAKSNFQGILSNVNKTTQSLVTTSASLQSLLNTQTGAMAQSLNNVNAFTKNLTTNTDKINNTLTNLEKTSKNLAALKLDETLLTLNNTVLELQSVIKKFNNDQGSIGKLMKDPGLYNKLNSLTFSMNTLVDDLKVNPKRYISIFGRKDKKIQPLTKPLSDTLQ